MTDSAYFKGFGIPLLLIMPQITIVLVWFYWPTFHALWWSLTLEHPFGGSREFVWFDNISDILSRPDFTRTLKITAIFTVCTTALAVSLSLIFAFFADHVVRGKLFYKMILIVPYAIAAPVVGVAFAYILHPNLGLMSKLNEIWPGLWNPFIDGRDAMIMVIIAFAWKNIAYNFVFFLAGFQSIPKSLIEAGAIAGAGPWRRFIDIQLPLMTPIFFFVLVINISEAFTDSFAIIDVMTKGGPGGATKILVYKIYDEGFIGLDFSGAAAQSAILMFLIIAVSIIQFRYVERRVHYTV